MPFHCTNHCEPFDLTCHQLCAVTYNNDLKKCPCGEFCSDGCPCKEWECHDEELPSDHDHIHLLILNPDDKSEPNLKQIKVSFIDRDTFLEEKSHQVQLKKPSIFQTKRHNMCSFVHKGKMYLAGSSGSDTTYQMQTRLGRLEANEIIFMDDLTKRLSFNNEGEKVPFTFGYGICTGDVAKGQRHALLCHPTEHKKVCWAWDGAKKWTEMTTNYEHYKAGVSRWVKKKTCAKTDKGCIPETTYAVIFSGRDDEYGRTERLMEKNGKYSWITRHNSFRFLTINDLKK